jgi:hypothetical protein
VYFIVCLYVFLMAQWEGFTIYWSQDVERNKSGINLVVTESMDSPLLVTERCDVDVTAWRHVSPAARMINQAGVVRHWSSLCIDCIDSIAVDSDYGKSFKWWSSGFGRNVENKHLNTIRCKNPLKTITWLTGPMEMGNLQVKFVACNFLLARWTWNWGRSLWSATFGA